MLVSASPKLARVSPPRVRSCEENKQHRGANNSTLESSESLPRPGGERNHHLSKQVILCDPRDSRQQMSKLKLSFFGSTASTLITVFCFITIEIQWRLSEGSSPYHCSSVVAVISFVLSTTSPLKTKGVKINETSLTPGTFMRKRRLRQYSHTLRTHSGMCH